MMATVTKPPERSSPVRRARAQAGKPKPSAQAAKKKAEAGAAMAVARRSARGGGSVTGKLARTATKKLAGTATKKALKHVARTAVRASSTLLRAAAERGGELGKSAGESALWRPLPVQVSVDVAAPIDVVWQEWIGSDSLPEGVHRIEHLERDGDRLTGTIAGPRSSRWKAEILDERECESFAWRSQEGTDCAGLATFHRISDRLTRVELDLDVLPRNPAETLRLSLHMAHRHAEADLRRFKARVEFINPDVYESNGNHKSRASKKARDA